MSRTWKALVVLLGVQAALSAAAIVLDWTSSCAACRPGGLSPGIAGLAFYGILLVVAVTRGPSRLLCAAILFAFGVHIALAAQMLLTGLVCGLCVAATVGSLALVALSISMDPANLGRLGFIAPWSALLVAAGFGSARPQSSIPAGSVSVVVFTQPDCPYCEELRKNVIPEIEREFGPRIRIDYRPAADLPAVRRVPTLILTPARTGSTGRVIEGLPTVERLRGAIRDLETRS